MVHTSAAPSPALWHETRCAFGCADDGAAAVAWWHGCSVATHYTAVGVCAREKDGLWAVLAWLSILAHRNVPHEDLGAKLAKLAPGAPLASRQHWPLLKV